MGKILAVLLWPAGIALIVCIGAVLARRVSDGPLEPGSGGLTGLSGSPGRRRHGHALGNDGAGQPSAIRSAGKFLLILLGCSIVAWGVMCLLGVVAIHAGPTIDKPIFNWTIAHRYHFVKEGMVRATEVGDKYPTWAAAATAAVLLAVTWRRNRWLPPVALGTLIIWDHFLTLAINHTEHRTPPPGAGGIFPSGGSERAILFYGLIAYLVWREFSGQRRAAIWAATVVAALGFHEGYTRWYLAVHWTTDIVGGWFYGCLMLAIYILAIRLVAGPARVPSLERPLVAPTRNYPEGVPG
ncbi:MAG TPA: phosphatase PAP2 family protein [Streptosporangiaceae bacterium]|jgi:membrane-associated phospholipid phosphatase